MKAFYYNRRVYGTGTRITKTIQTNRKAYSLSRGEYNK